MYHSMCYSHERGKNYWLKRAIFIPVAIAAGVFIFGSLVMLLWNGILVPVLGLGTVTFWQALGILILAKILFGGFHGRHGNGRFYAHRKAMREKWMNMTPEEKEKMKKEWQDRWGCKDTQA